MTGICSHCKEHCEIIFDDCGPVSNCCSAPILDNEGPEMDEADTPGGHLPYGGGDQ